MAKTPAHPATLNITRFRFDRNTLAKQRDQLAVEEPLEITLNIKQAQHTKHESITLAITMRTPGNDRELVAGFLFAEGIIKNKNDILNLSPNPDSANPDNSISVMLCSEPGYDPDRLQRHFLTNSSCGVCGKTSMQALELQHQPDLYARTPLITANFLCQLPHLLREQQQQFSTTGGTHSAALFGADGKLLRLREDVGRHNAMDKLIGSLLLDDQLVLARQALLLVSGRASFELVQKALMADIPLLASIGAPTSLACQLAGRHNMTLVGFLKSDSFNIYSAPERIS